MESVGAPSEYGMPPDSYFPLESVASSLEIATASLPYFPLQAAPATVPNDIYATAATPVATFLQTYTAPAQPITSSSKPAEFLGGTSLKIVPTITLSILVILTTFQLSFL